MAERAGWPYWVLLALRAALVLSPGYVHTDEWFQSPEIAATVVCGSSARIPWEFSGCTDPARSMMPPLLGSGAPIALAAMFGGCSSGWTVLLAPRLWLLALSPVSDWCVCHFCKRMGVSHQPVLLSMMATWSSALLSTRPFSNTLEAFWLAALLALVAEAFARSRARPAGLAIHALQVAAGAVLGLGVFTRFTFVLFAAAPGVAMVALAAWRGFGSGPAARRHEAPLVQEHGPAQAAGGVAGWADGADLADPPSASPSASSSAHEAAGLRRRKRIAGGPAGHAPPAAGGAAPSSEGHGVTDGGSVSGAAAAIAVAAAEAGLGLAVAVAALVALDTAQFGGAEPVLAPLANFVYNLDPQNLALHGTHPRWLHALVNAPLVCGALVPAALLESWLRRRRSSSGWQQQVLWGPPPEDAARWVCWGVVVAGLGGLSWAPHQEPRQHMDRAACPLSKQGAVSDRFVQPASGRPAVFDNGGRDGLDACRAAGRALRRACKPGSSTGAAAVVLASGSVSRNAVEAALDEASSGGRGSSYSVRAERLASWWPHLSAEELPGWPLDASQLQLVATLLVCRAEDSR
ncbi:hypothetical protein FNF27_04263 [Cafeteria roenbergensis]|uniref:Mannosyltransferase n=1 Tax=Cafeteria roenbergensis TaxID=33653 RepID=A0A5A8EEH2_CAFRO|nr:hypothetical protein FNF27_04263 [Cafeteria roenbergensis]